MALDVADDQGDVVVGQGDDVVPVAAELQARGAGQIAGDGDRAGQGGQTARQQLALEHADELVLGVEGVGAHQRLPRETGGGGEQGAFVGVEVVGGVPADEAGAGHAARGGQRQDGEAAGADVGECGFEDGAGRPDLGAALPQGGGQGGHGPHGCLGPLAAPLQTPELRPGLRFGRVEDGHDEPVVLQLGEGDAVGPERGAEGGDDGLADVADGARHGEGGGQALDAGHVGDVGAQGGGVGDSAHEPGRTALAAGRHAAAQPEPLGWSRGLEDAELQFPFADGHVTGLEQGHQRGQVLGDGQAEQGLDLAVEGGPAHAEQLQDAVADLDPAGVDGEAERVGAQFRAFRGGDGHGTDHRVGDQFEALAVLVVESVRILADGDETGPAVVTVRGQHGQVEVPPGHPARIGAGGDFLRAEEDRPPVR